MGMEFRLGRRGRRGNEAEGCFGSGRTARLMGRQVVWRAEVSIWMFHPTTCRVPLSGASMLLVLPGRICVLPTHRKTHTSPYAKSQPRHEHTDLKSREYSEVIHIV